MTNYTDDRVLADALVDLDFLKFDPGVPDSPYGLPGKNIWTTAEGAVHDWRVAGAVAEKCATMCLLVTEDGWHAEANDDWHGYDKSASRAIIEAGVRALTGEGE